MFFHFASCVHVVFAAVTSSELLHVCVLVYKYLHMCMVTILQCACTMYQYFCAGRTGMLVESFVRCPFILLATNMLCFGCSYTCIQELMSRLL